MLKGTGQLRLQGPVFVHAHCSEGVAGSEGREEANGVFGGEAESGTGTKTETDAGAGRPVQQLGGGGVNSFVPVLGGDGTK